MRHYEPSLVTTGPLSVVHRPWSMLIIGYGSTLRGDDGVGQEVALAAGRWELDGVAALAVHQLTPELAATLAGCDEAIFVDASCEVEAPTLTEVAPRRSEGASGHSCDPAGLLALAEALYGRCPRARLLAVPASCFDLGAPFSPLAEAGVAAALEVLREVVVGR